MRLRWMTFSSQTPRSCTARTEKHASPAQGMAGVPHFEPQTFSADSLRATVSCLGCRLLHEERMGQMTSSAPFNVLSAAILATGTCPRTLGRRTARGTCRILCLLPQRVGWRRVRTLLAPTPRKTAMGNDVGRCLSPQLWLWYTLRRHGDRCLAKAWALGHHLLCLRRPRSLG